jgi:hypothetical protein
MIEPRAGTSRCQLAYVFADNGECSATEVAQADHSTLQAIANSLAFNYELCPCSITNCFCFFGWYQYVRSAAWYVVPCYVEVPRYNG